MGAMSRWPFADEGSFWAWAMDSFAELQGQDDDLLLHDVAGFDLLVSAAGIGECPKQKICSVALEDFAAKIVWRGQADELDALRAAAGPARDERHPFVREWAAYAQRLLGYSETGGQVNRAKAEQMAADMFAGPVGQWRRGGSEWLTVEVGATAGCGSARRGASRGICSSIGARVRGGCGIRC